MKLKRSFTLYIYISSLCTGNNNVLLNAQSNDYLSVLVHMRILQNGNICHGPMTLRSTWLLGDDNTPGSRVCNAVIAAQASDWRLLPPSHGVIWPLRGQAYSCTHGPYIGYVVTAASENAHFWLFNYLRTLNKIYTQSWRMVKFNNMKFKWT